MQTQVQQILDRCNQVIEKAKLLYGLDLSKVHIRFDLKGRAAGQAYRRSNQYGVRFNRDMLTREAFEHVLNNTVPHEFAHLICFMNPAFGNNHNSGWERVCISLGGSGATRHKEEIVLGRGTTYEYRTSNGNTVRIGDKHHRYIQTGGRLDFRRGKGSVDKSCTYSIVGMNGRTLADPVTRQGEPKKEVPASTMITATLQKLATVPVHTPREVKAATPVVNRVPPARVQETPAVANCRRIMFFGYREGVTYEKIIAKIVAEHHFTDTEAREIFKANAAKMAIPAKFYQ